MIDTATTGTVPTGVAEVTNGDDPAAAASSTRSADPDGHVPSPHDAGRQDAEPHDAAPRRERITSPLAQASPHVRRSPRQEIDDESGVGEVYIRSLMRSQLRSALWVVALLVVFVVSLPLVFTVVEPLARATVGGVPVPWILLGGLAYPFLLVLGWLYVRRAERAEADFAELVEPRRAASGPDREAGSR